MKVWKWLCATHQLSLFTMQTGIDPPIECSSWADLVYPEYGPCRFTGQPVLSVYVDSP